MRILASFVLLVVALDVVNGDPLQCSADAATITESRGYLNLTRSSKRCHFTTKSGIQMLGIKTDDLILRNGDYFLLGSSKDMESRKNYTPPLDAGYFITGFDNPEIQFNFADLDNTTMMVEYFAGAVDLPINADVNNDFLIAAQNVNNLTLNIYKTIPNTVHLEISGTKFANSQIRHMLLDGPSSSVPITFQHGRSVRVKTSAVLTSCSGVFNESKEIVGPAPTSRTDKYKCVNIFRALSSGQAHFEVDFKNFVNLTDVEDRLVLEDSVARTVITRSRLPDFTGQITTFHGNELAVIYESLSVIEPISKQFSLKVNLQTVGGIVSKTGDLELPASGPVRFVLDPGVNSYAAIELKKTSSLPSLNITVYRESKVVAQLNGVMTIPPVIALSEKKSLMVLEMSSPSYKGLQITFKPLSQHCHSAITGPPSGFSITATDKPVSCIWLISSLANAALRFDNVRLPPEANIQIQPLMSDKPIYNGNIQSALPSFSLKQAYIRVEIPKPGHVEASLSALPGQMLYTLKPKDKITLKPYGYSLSYPWSVESQVFVINATNTSVVVSASVLDLRTDEKLLVKGSELKLKDDLFGFGLINVTLARPSKSEDYTSRKGFELQLTAFDQVIEVDPSKNSNYTTPKNVSSVLIKISKPGKRIAYNITNKSDNKDFELSVHDGRSILSNLADNTTNQTTSDTLLLELRSMKQNVFAPQMTIVFNLVSLNTTSDHLCDGGTRSVPTLLLCKGKSYCDDGSDLRVFCGSAAPVPKIIETGVSGIAVFILSVLMLMLGGVSAIYGPDFLKNLDTRFRSSQYSTFSSVE